VNARRPLLAALAAVVVLTAACGSDDTADSTESTQSGPSEAPGTSEVSGGSPTDAATSTGDCPPEEGAGEQTQQFDSAPPMCLEAGPTYEAVVTTNKGEFTIALDPDQAPATTNNFVFLARNRYFDDTVCHRIIPNFVVQCGDPTGTGTGGPGYTIVDEPPAAGQYEVGSIAMAKTLEPDSGGSQFFIITGSDGAALPPDYSLFGTVTAGLESAVAAMATAGTPAGAPSEPIEIQSIRIIQS